MASDPELPEGLVYQEDFVSREEERELLAVVERLDYRTVTMRGQTARRTVQHFGLDYAYESGELVETAPLPEPLVWLRDRC
ncbi:MAG TPA: hypothetical protein VD931_01585, partial [Baekduia sp.]|nr:hypothetical protein [Baekduia sp.]